MPVPKRASTPAYLDRSAATPPDHGPKSRFPRAPGSSSWTYRSFPSHIWHRHCILQSMETKDVSQPIHPLPEGSRGDRLSSEIRSLALAHGFHLARVTTAEPFAGMEETLNARIAAGHLGGLDWFTPERAHIASAPQRLVPWARALLVL